MPVGFRVRLGDGSSVSARLYTAEGEALAWLILAPGAGAGQAHRFMVAFGRGLASRGLDLVTFDFPYIEAGRHAPDSNATLEACWMAVLHAVVERAGANAKIFAGGKSMGGRIASQVAARPSGGADAGGVTMSGLVFLGYPLHPPGRPDQRRTAHWPAIHAPALFIQGSRDPFAAPDELREDLSRYGGDARLIVVEGGNHSFEVPRRSGRTQDDVYADVQESIVGWIRERAGC